MKPPTKLVTREPILFSFLHIRDFFFFFFAALGLCCKGAFSSCGARGPLSSCNAWASLAVASLVAEHQLGVHGLQQLWHSGSFAPRHVGSSQTGD